MKLVILGATGQTGIQVVRQALDAGHHVTAVVRTPSKMKIQHDHLQVVEGNIFSEESLAKHFQGNDAVVSCLGFPRTKHVTGYTESGKTIAAASRKSGVFRIVAMTSYFTDTTTASGQGFFVRRLLVPYLKPVLSNMREMEKFYEANCDDLNFTVVRPPGLVNGPVSSKEIKKEVDGFFVKDGPSGIPQMPRADVARFLLGCVTEQRLYKKIVAISF